MTAVVVRTMTTKPEEKKKKKDPYEEIAEILREYNEGLPERVAEEDM